MRQCPSPLPHGRLSTQTPIQPHDAPPAGFARRVAAAATAAKAHTRSPFLPAGLVIVSSESHRRVRTCGFDFEKECPPPAERYDSLHAYAFSNLCRVLWARALAPTVPYPVVSLHPGVVTGTGMVQHMVSAAACGLMIRIAHPRAPIDAPEGLWVTLNARRAYHF